MHAVVLAWVLPARPPTAIEVFVPEVAVEMVAAAEAPEATDAPEPAIAAAEPAPEVPAEAPEAVVEPGPASSPTAVPAATEPDPPAVPPSPVPRRAAQVRTVATVVPRPPRQAPEPGGSAGAATRAASAVPPADYVAAVQAVLARQRRYPPEARARGAEGTAWLRFTIRRDGGIAAANVARSSGDPALDAATEEMAARAVMPPLPDSWASPTMTLIAPVSYSTR